MATKQKPRRSSSIKNWILLIPNLINLVFNITTLFRIEARLAGKSIITIIMLSFVFAAVLTSTWLCILALLFLYFNFLHWSWALSLVILLLLNILFMIVIGLIIAKTKKNLLFPMTCRQGVDLCRYHQED